MRLLSSPFPYFIFSTAAILAQSLQDEINSIPSCSSDCIAKFSTDAGCAVGDFTCQCDNEMDIIGHAGIPSPPQICLLHDCHIRNTTS